MVSLLDSLSKCSLEDVLEVLEYYDEPLVFTIKGGEQMWLFYVWDDVHGLRSYMSVPIASRDELSDLLLGRKDIRSFFLDLPNVWLSFWLGDTFQSARLMVWDTKELTWLPNPGVTWRG